MVRTNAEKTRLRKRVWWSGVSTVAAVMQANARGTCARKQSRITVVYNLTNRIPNQCMIHLSLYPPASLSTGGCKSDAISVVVTWISRAIITAFVLFICVVILYLMFSRGSRWVARGGRGHPVCFNLDLFFISISSLLAEFVLNCKSLFICLCTFVAIVLYLCVWY